MTYSAARRDGQVKAASCGRGRIWVIPQGVANKSVPPSIKETAFDCPHCGAYTTQTWHTLYAESRLRATPFLFEEDWQTSTAYQFAPQMVERAVDGLIVRHFQPKPMNGPYLYNLHVSECFNCQNFSVWVHDKLLFPESRQGPPPNPDMSDSVRMDYEEASKILNLSPRGAAALLRLAIQKLCKELGEKGDNVNDDIASLVKKGLAPLIQKALDSVRVIGNDAVHPGTLDLKDDPDTAAKLFRLVNIIVEQMISNPKHVDELFDKIPANKKKGIEERDK